MALLKDYEKEWGLHTIMGFIWSMAWIVMGVNIQTWFDLGEKNPLIIILGLIGIIGFLLIMVRGLVILVSGMYKDIKEEWDEKKINKELDKELNDDFGGTSYY